MCNGWTNCATWNTVMWLTSDHTMYQTMLCQFAGYATVTGHDLYEYCHLLWPCGHNPDGNELGEVNWSEVAGAVQELINMERITL